MQVRVSLDRGAPNGGIPDNRSSWAAASAPRLLDSSMATAMRRATTATAGRAWARPTCTSAGDVSNPSPSSLWSPYYLFSLVPLDGFKPSTSVDDDTGRLVCESENLLLPARRASRRRDSATRRAGGPPVELPGAYPAWPGTRDE